MSPKLKALVPKDPQIPKALEAEAASSKLVDGDDDVLLARDLEEMSAEVGPHEACGSGDEDAHCFSHFCEKHINVDDEMPAPQTTAAIRSSYLSRADFGAVLAAAVFSKRPLERAAEYGILDGFSLDILERFSPADTTIEAKDLFDDFKGNHSSRELLAARFGSSEKVSISHGDFNNAGKDLADCAYDLIHVDVANTGETYEAAARMLPQKLKPGGILLLEGGTPERDAVEWMQTYHKKPICAVIERWLSEDTFEEVCVLGEFPGLTLVRPWPATTATGSAPWCSIS